jgi:PHD/YefM family antitoxin component YafN of YafNO toxin-antitoxin module
MVKRIEDIDTLYKNLAKIASEQGYYLISKKYYESLCNTVEYTRSENKRLSKRNKELRDDIRAERRKRI